ncbi:hypothetical protein, partial [Corynebacterium parakroppenstedtii]|uniref:hypothetical protein n=1 Tax=Corynebacterium parakroppenstedtii TaxID=2828363 RepID=UPI0030EE0C27
RMLSRSALNLPRVWLRPRSMWLALLSTQILKQGHTSTNTMRPINTGIMVAMNEELAVHRRLF